MALFPAYAGDSIEEVAENYIKRIEEDVVSPATEMRLLASGSSDSGDERSETAEPSLPSSLQPPPPPDCDFYIDTKFDAGNFRVSTLYYPGRPEYNRVGSMGCKKSVSERRRARRYYQRPAAAAAPSPDELVTALRRALREVGVSGALPLWERYAELRPEEALREAEAARAVRPRSQLALRALLAVARQQDSHTQHLRRLHTYIQQEKELSLRCSLWEHVVECAARAGEGEEAVAESAAAALRDLPRHPPAYPHIFYTYGAYLRAAGLWEKLVLLMELFAAMNFPPGPFPPAARPAAAGEAAEAALLEREEQLVRSALPLGTVWVRAERARAAAHWRPAPAAALQLDPQRAPQPADVAGLLIPVVDASRRFVLAVQLLRLAKVPLLPGAEHVASCAALCGPASVADGAEALLPLLRAARRLPAAHPGALRAAPARALLAAALDPPHYFTDDHGYLSWVNALWESCCVMEENGGAAERRRVALLCWRLRWLHALLLLVEQAEEGGAAEVRRIRAEAREALRVHAGDSPLPFAQFARIEAAAGGAPRGVRVAVRALRAALAVPGRDSHTTHTALYLARVVCELSGAESPEGRWATCAAVLGRDLPADPGAESPPPDLLLRAAQACEERCAELERSLSEEPHESEAELEEGEELVRALLPGECEWWRARALLAAPPRRRELLRAAMSGGAGGARAARCREGEAAALCAAAGPGAHRGELAALHPHNAYLAIVSSAAPLWCGGSLAGRGGWWGGAGSAARALAALLPHLLHQTRHPDDVHGSERCVRVCRRVCGGSGGGGGGGAGGALAAALWLRCEALAPRSRAPQALLAALDAYPQHKWLYVRGAESGGDARELADLLLERALRLHVLPDELAPVTT